VFSHLSEEMHNKVLAELSRLLKPGGLLVVTTCGREFIEAAAAMRKRADLSSLHPGPRSCAEAFPETQEALLRYDRGDYCFAPVVHDWWAYWGWAAISKNYVLKNWGYGLTFVDYIDDRNLCSQNVVVMKKGAS
jgi:SAM-dependent methyltransferase